ncbi:4a-hydroxytetrahydrobiopterin dehydratase [Prochlorothrix hollandica]|uniref:4a-hydroxytetrahydrobiopterin dehydratase n=1 Tax=Prochlorothrix hollandica PCC 9006 = CALU 1027 TaxID=317619 RepID=A0A0M2PX71_PROHO|nr:4a-hydroxytetrahydrobiopterin dehydratase [Prochlorothrix hollandica]KKI99268.1 pterin-4-alpha-carbinolamine dehydratase [Prochlorothrix hollandica PCC 9006 = CALU 1027]
MNPLLTSADLATQVAQLPPGWQVDGKTLRCRRVFGDFLEAIAFVNALVEPAETAGHHPDLTISYNQVTVVLTTHDAGGLTQNDFDLAQIISNL